MDINNDLQQINTFVKGMNTDVSDALMDSSQYRYAENVRLATNTEENTGELRLIEGTKQFTYGYGDIAAMTSIRDILVVITKDSRILKKDFSIDDTWRIVFDPGDGEKISTENLSLVTRWENDKDVKLYIADGVHNLMYVNLKDEGGQIIQKISDIVSVSDQLLDQPKAQLSTNTGQLPPVKIQYAYRMYTEGGAATTLSPLSNIITLYKGNEGYKYTDTETDKAIDITIPQYEGSDNFDKMQIFRVAYQQVGQDPKVSLIYEGDYQSTYTDTGREVQSQAFEDILAMMQNAIVPTIIESKNDYMFAANVKYKQDDVDRGIEAAGDFRIYSSGDEGRTYNAQFSSENIKHYNESFWMKKDDPTKIGGHGDFMDWEYCYNTIYINDKNEKFRDFDLTNQTFEQICSLRQGEVYRYGAIFYNQNGQRSSVKWLCDIMIPQRTPYSIIDRNGERICIAEQIGIKFTVHHLPDGFEAAEIVRAPRQLSDRIRIVQGIAGFPYKLYKRDVNVSNDAPVPFMSTNDICAPYLISTNKFKFVVRQEDKIEINENMNRIWTGDYDIAHSDCALSRSESDNTKLVFACPEYSYQPDDIKNILSNNIAVEVAYKRHISSQKLNLPGWEGHDELYNRNGDVVQAINYKGTNTSNYWYLTSDSGDGGIFGDEIEGLQVYEYNKQIGFYCMANYNDAHSPYISNNGVNNVSFYKIYPTDNISSSGEIINIKQTAYTTSPKALSGVDDRGYAQFENSRVNIDAVSYINWSVPLLYHQRDDQTAIHYNNQGEYDNLQINEDLDRLWERYPLTSPVGSTGKYILMSLNGTLPFDSGNQNFMTVPVVNIVKTNPNPYGGYDTKDRTNYSQHGYYIKGLDSKEVFDGDCYPGVFIFNAQHAWFNENLINVKEGQRYFVGTRQVCVYFIPLESNIDLSATYGDLYNRISAEKDYYIQDEPDSFDGYTQDDLAYLYNTAYGYEPDNIQYSAIYYSSISDNNYDCRVYYSSPKTNGELIDSWLYFAQNNCMDVDTRYGKITNMRLFKDKLMFWQEHGTGVLSVNERTILNDDESHNIIVGTGDVLSRYDYISTVYGMKPNQYNAEVQSNYTQYWWDGYNKELLAYTGGMELIPLTKTKGCTNYINSREESSDPMLAYDSKYDEILAQVVKTADAGETLVYNEQTQSFQSIYTFVPIYRATINNDLYLANTELIYVQNKQHIDNYSLLFNKPAFPKVRIVVNKNNIYTKTFDNLTFGGRMYKGSLPTIVNWPMQRGNGEYIKEEHLNTPMHHLIFTFETPLKQKSTVRGDKAASVDEYDYRLAIPRNGSDVEYGNRMRGKTMQCEIASDYNSTDFSLQYITTKFRMSWS